MENRLSRVRRVMEDVTGWRKGEGEAGQIFSLDRAKGQVGLRHR